MEGSPSVTTIFKNVAERYLALAQGHFNEVFVKEFHSNMDHKEMLLEKGKRAFQKQVLLADVVFGAQGLSEGWRMGVGQLATDTKAFWHELRMAIEESSEDSEIGVQQAGRRAVAQGHLEGIQKSLNAFFDRVVSI